MMDDSPESLKGFVTIVFTEDLHSCTKDSP